MILKNGKRIFVIAFFALCLLPVLAMPFASGGLSENRNLSEVPKWYQEDGSWNQAYFEEWSTYVAEHFALRSQLVELDSQLKYQLLSTPSDEQVVIGKGDWFFFDATLADYAGVTLPQEEITQIADKLVEACDYIESLGKEPLIMIVPNKNSIYEEYMPARFGKKAKITNLILLQEQMEEKGVPYVDARAILLAGKEVDELYLHQDTHWNNTGARLVLNQIYKQLGLEDSHTLTGYTIENSHESDLGQILFPTKENLEPQRIYEQDNTFSYEGRVRSMDDMEISTTADGNGKSILVFRDSFGRAMIPYMAEVFDNCTFVRSTPYQLDVIEETECDYVLIEIVERNIVDLGGME